MSIYVRLNGQKFNGVFEHFSFTLKFLGLKLQNKDFFKDKMVLRVVFFYKIDVKMVTNWSVRLEKTHNN